MKQILSFILLIFSFVASAQVDTTSYVIVSEVFAYRAYNIHI